MDHITKIYIHFSKKEDEVEEYGQNSILSWHNFNAHWRIHTYIDIYLHNNAHLYVNQNFNFSRIFNT